MTSGTIDQIKVGHVLRYVYLFKSEAAAGRDEGVKERPVVVIDVDYDTRRVMVLRPSRMARTIGALNGIGLSVMAGPLEI